MSQIIHEMMQILAEGHSLDDATAEGLMDAIMSGLATPIQVGGILMALRVRGETIDELVGFARSMRRHAQAIPVHRRPLMDTCGTGGDRSFSFNVSTVSAFVVAGAGVSVAKHGNRSASSKSGSADLLEALGVPLTPEPSVVARVIDEVGFGFVFAQAVHTSMRYAAPARQELGVRTVFNLLGPLTNPVNPERQLLGVASRNWLEPVTHVLARLGTERAMVVHGDGGLDEISLSGPTHFGMVAAGRVQFGEVLPEELGLPRYPKEAMLGGDPAYNADVCRRVLRGEPGPYLDMVLANAGAALFVAELVPNLAQGVERARESIGSGAAARILERLQEWGRMHQTA